MMPDPQIRTTTRNRNRPRRLSACHRHPSEPVTGFCALCLRDRLAGLDSSAAEAEVEKVAVCSRRTRGHADASSSTAAPGLRRSKSVAAEKGESLNGLVTDQRRKSCDVRGRSTLSDLFVVDDTKKGGGGVARVESRNLGFSSFAEPVLETKEDEEDDDEEEHDDDDDDDDNEIRVSGDVFVRNEVDDDGDIEEGDLKTMKEFIDIELQNKRRNFWEAASVFSQKLRKWRQKQKQKKQNRDCNGGTDIDRSKLGQFRDTQSEVADYGLGRRSCDTEPRFSIDAHRLSVEDPRFSFDEHRSSWDGYMIARTIPRLTPMLSIVDSMIIPPPVNRGTITTMENLQMHSISEDGASSGQSNSNSDASTSNRGSSSSSMKSFSTKTTGLGGDEVKSASNARVSPANDVIFQGTKLVITENELKDWHLKSTKNSNIASVSVSNTPISTTVNNSSNMHKKAMPSKWRKVCNLWSHKKNLEEIPENVNSNPKLDRNTNSMNSRNFVLDRNRSTRYSTSDLDNNGLLRLYLTPFRNSTRRSKSGKSSSKGRNMSPSMASNNFQLN
ncbi:hypothetical protein Lser_V15G26643 [Lactuca serriola]